MMPKLNKFFFFFFFGIGMLTMMQYEHFIPIYDYNIAWIAKPPRRANFSTALISCSKSGDLHNSRCSNNRMCE